VATVVEVGALKRARGEAFYLAVLGLEVQAEGTEPERRWAYLGDG